MTTSLEHQVSHLGPWFHNLRLGEQATVQTAPDHPLGDFPSNFWQFFKHVLPDDLTGQTVLDIGCNGGFYSFEMKRRGAARVVGKVAPLVRKRMLFQSMERGSCEAADFQADDAFADRDVFFDERFPRMYFIEHAYAGDNTNWWIPNPSCTQVMLRSVGVRIVDHPCQEVYVCEPAGGMT